MRRHKGGSIPWLEHTHRALKPNWFDNGVLTNKAYRRAEKDVDGLSVASTHEIAKLMITVGNGVASVQIRVINDLGLQLKPDDDDHGCIVGVPYAHENYDLAMQLADKLLAASAVKLERWNRR